MTQYQRIIYKYNLHNIVFYSLHISVQYAYIYS